MTYLSSESPTQLLTEPVRPARMAISLARHYGAWAAVCYRVNGELTFAHVLSVPETKVIWPGEAVELFPLSPALFAVSPDTGKYVQDGLVANHMRCETLRLCEGNTSTLDYMEQEFVLDCEFGGPFPASFGDRCEDEDELFYYPEDIPSTLPGEGYPTAGSPPTEKED